MTAIVEPAASTVPIVEAIAAAKRRQRRSYRIWFAATWIVVVGVLVASLTTSFDWPFLAEWWQYILGGVEATIILTVASITLACGLALIGALGRLSSNPVFYESLGVGFDNAVADNDSLVAAVDAIIGEMRDDGTLLALSQQWFNGLDLVSGQ